jgi:hypothetical protein
MHDTHADSTTSSPCRSTVCNSPWECRLCKSTLLKCFPVQCFKKKYLKTEDVLPYCAAPILCQPVADAASAHAPQLTRVSKIRVRASRLHSSVPVDHPLGHQIASPPPARTRVTRTQQTHPLPAVTK